MSDGVRELLSRATAGVTERYTHRGLSRLSEGLGSDAGAGRIVARRLPKVRDEGRDRHLPLENGYWRGATEVRKCPDGGMAERLNAPVLKCDSGTSRESPQIVGISNKTRRFVRLRHLS